MKRRMGNPRAYVASFMIHKQDKKAKTDGCQTPEYKRHPNNTAVRSIDQGLKRTMEDKRIPLACASVNGNDKTTSDQLIKLQPAENVSIESPQLSVSKLQPAKNVNEEDPILSNLTDIHVESALHDCLGNTSNQREPSVTRPFMITMNRNLSSYIQEIENICASRMHDLMQTEIVENGKFKLFMENEKLKFEKNTLKSNLNTSLIDNHSAKHGDLCPLSRQSPHELNGFDQYRSSQKRKLVHLQIAARNKEKNLKQKWMKDAYHGKLEVSSDTIPLPVSNFQAESFEDFSCWGEASGCTRNVAGSVILSDESNNMYSTSKDVPENNPDGHFRPLTVSGIITAPEICGQACREETSSSLHLLSSELQPAENVIVEDPILSNLTDIHVESVIHDCLGNTSNQREPSEPRPFMITMNLQGHEPCADPFQNELIRVQKEVEIVNLTLEQKKLQLKLELDNAIQKLQEKYITLVKDTEAEADSKIKSSKIIYDKLQKNQVLAEQFKAEFYEKAVTIALEQ